jgi:hypothetical protein
VVLRRTFRPKSYEMVLGWRKLHNKELHSLYSLTNIIIMHVKEDGMGRAWGRRGMHIKVQVGKPTGKTTRGTYTQVEG